MGLFVSVHTTKLEAALPLPGDDMIRAAAVQLDRAFTLPALPVQVWLWFVRLGKKRGGWYFPLWISWLFVRGSRGVWYIDPKSQDLEVGELIDHWGGKDG